MRDSILDDQYAADRERVDRLQDTGVFPVVGDDVSQAHARDVAQALEDGGVPVIEFVDRYDGVMENIAAVADNPAYEGVVGIGSVQDAETAEEAIWHGADFVVSHRAPDGVADVCRDYDVPSILGAFTPQEIGQIHEEQSPDMIKWYPAMAGGPETLSEIRGPAYDDIAFIASGGVTPDNAGTYREAGATGIAYGISDVDDLDAVTDEAAQFVDAIARDIDDISGYG